MPELPEVETIARTLRPLVRQRNLMRTAESVEAFRQGIFVVLLESGTSTPAKPCGMRGWIPADWQIR
jgi:formamidopyrimidine-DNA glycosylase